MCLLRYDLVHVSSVTGKMYTNGMLDPWWYLLDHVSRAISPAIFLLQLEVLLDFPIPHFKSTSRSHYFDDGPTDDIPGDVDLYFPTVEL